MAIADELLSPHHGINYMLNAEQAGYVELNEQEIERMILTLIRIIGDQVPPVVSINRHDPQSLRVTTDRVLNQYAGRLPASVIDYLGKWSTTPEFWQTWYQLSEK